MHLKVGDIRLKEILHWTKIIKINIYKKQYYFIKNIIKIDQTFNLTQAAHTCGAIFLVKMSQHAERGRQLSQDQSLVNVYFEILTFVRLALTISFSESNGTSPVTKIYKSVPNDQTVLFSAK